ncbi:MAG: hypothetical protein KAI77_05120 [Gammaproteobacteria bacterium]|nr:hypothetical protein [Gammaproteobacteria bacterium]
MNRSVLIQWKRDIEYVPGKIEGKLPSIEKVVDDCLRALHKQEELGLNLPSQQVKRIDCYLKRIRDLHTDDQYISYARYVSGSHYLWQKVEPAFLENSFVSRLRYQVKQIHFKNQGDEREIVRRLEDLDWQIIMLRKEMVRVEFPVGGGGSVEPGVKQIHDWISERQDPDRKPTSILICR